MPLARGPERIVALQPPPGVLCRRIALVVNRFGAFLAYLTMISVWSSILGVESIQRLFLNLIAAFFCSTMRVVF